MTATPLRQLSDWPTPLFSAEDEAALYHRPGPAFFSLLFQDGAHKVQRSYRTRDMAQVLRLLPRDRDTWLSQAQFVAPNRRVVNLASLSSLFLDIDCYQLGLAPSQAENLLLLHCEDNHLLLPSLIIWSGRGIQVKWLLDQPLPRHALPRWNAAQRALVARFAHLGADPAARDASRVLRLVETVNTKTGAVVHVSWANVLPSGEIQAHGFDHLCEQLLPFSREQLADQRAQRAQREQQAQARRAVFQLVDGNPDARRGFSARQLAWHRLEDLRALYRLRQGRLDGLSMPLLFWSLNFLLLSGATNTGQMWHEATALCREYGLGDFRRQSELSTLYAKAKEHEAGQTVTYNGRAYPPLYTPRNATLIDLFRIEPDEQRHLKTILGDDETKTRHRQREETRRRQAGAVTRTEYLSASEDKRASARIMTAQGMSTREIGAQLGVSHMTVARWIKVV